MNLSGEEGSRDQQIDGKMTEKAQAQLARKAIVQLVNKVNRVQIARKAHWLSDREKLIRSANLDNSILGRGRREEIAPPDDIRSALSIQALLNAGVHLGHSPENWNKNMLPFIYGERNRIHVINLEHTLRELRRASAFLKHLGSLGGRVLFVGKRPQIHTIVYDAAHLGRSAYAFELDHAHIETGRRKMVGQAEKRSSETFMSIVKRLCPREAHTVSTYERKHWYSKNERVDQSTGARVVVQAPEELLRVDPVNSDAPGAVVIADYMNCLDVITSCNKGLVPVVAICDTDCDPNSVQYAIPGNDDSLTSVSLILSVLALSVREGIDLARHAQLHV